MVRKLKHHEKKLLKKVDFVNWTGDNAENEQTLIARFGLQSRQEYIKYARLCGMIQALAAKLRKLAPEDPFRAAVTNALLLKLQALGLISEAKSLVMCDRLGVTAFCRRRLAVVVVRSRMAPNIGQATKMIKEGHVRVGPNVVSDPALLVSRKMEDFVTWTDTSKFKRKVLRYNSQLDDYDLL